jgi:hypothetical protein
MNNVCPLTRALDGPVKAMGAGGSVHVSAANSLDADRNVVSAPPETSRVESRITRVQSSWPWQEKLDERFCQSNLACCGAGG